MAAVMGLDASAVEEVCKEAAQGEVVSPANFNAPGQVVIAGHSGAVARAGEIASARKGRVIPLKVSAPFHCALMAPAARVVGSELDRVAIRPLSFPVIANVDANPNSEADRVKPLLVQQVDSPVRWAASIERMAKEGVTHVLELGPGKVLAGLIRRIAKEMTVLSVGDAASLAEAADFVRD